jgi:cyclic dehypoxanthinyl futalosine synthase
MGISREQALDCFRSDDLIGIGMEADAVRRRLHPEGVVSYAIERTIDCTDFGEPGSGADFEAICAQAGETLESGGTGLFLRSGASAKNMSRTQAGTAEALGWFERLFADIKRRYPSIWLTGLSAPELLALAEASELTLRDTLLRLHDAGLDSIAGDGAEIAAQLPWIEVHRTAHGVGMRTAATMVFGMGETTEQRSDFLEAVRRLQEETGGFTAFVPLSFKPLGRTLGAQALDDATAVESLKTLAVSRMFLDNIENVQSSWTAQGLKVRQMGLRFGGNDVGSVMLGNGAAKSSGGANGSSEEDLRRIIRDAGFKPVQRDTPYRTMFLN